MNPADGVAGKARFLLRQLFSHTLSLLKSPGSLRKHIGCGINLTKQLKSEKRKTKRRKTFPSCMAALLSPSLHPSFLLSFLSPSLSSFPSMRPSQPFWMSSFPSGILFCSPSWPHISGCSFFSFENTPSIHTHNHTPHYHEGVERVQKPLFSSVACVWAAAVLRRPGSHHRGGSCPKERRACKQEAGRGVIFLFLLRFVGAAGEADSPPSGCPRWEVDPVGATWRGEADRSEEGRGGAAGRVPIGAFPKTPDAPVSCSQPCKNCKCPLRFPARGVRHRSCYCVHI